MLFRVNLAIVGQNFKNFEDIFKYFAISGGRSV